MEPVIEVRGRFRDELLAHEAADALNRWLAWIAAGTPPPAPQAFEPLGLETSAWAWSLLEDVDWEFGPHAAAVGAEVVLTLETHDTHVRLSGLLRRLGALSARVVRAEPEE